jgi:hypothetical protein
MDAYALVAVMETSLYALVCYQDTACCYGDVCVCTGMNDIRTLAAVMETFMYALVCYQDTLENHDPRSESESFSCVGT